MHELLKAGFEVNPINEYITEYIKNISDEVRVCVYHDDDGTWGCSVEDHKYVDDETEEDMVILNRNVTLQWVLKLVDLLEGEG